MSRLKLLPWAAGVGLVTATLLGANRLLDNPGSSAGGPPADPKKAKPPANHPGGTVTPGVVDCEPGLLAYTLPDALPAATVTEVVAKEDADVKPGDVLVRFDTALVKARLASAEKAVQAAVYKHQEAEEAVNQASLKVEEAAQAVAHAEGRRPFAKRAVELNNYRIEETFRAERSADTTQARLDQRRRNDPELLKALLAEAEVENAVQEATIKKKQAEALVAAARKQVASAAAHAAALQSQADEVKQTLARYELKADAAGRVGQVTAKVGQAVYPQTRPPLVVVVPDGPRVVRAEVQPEYAPDVADKVGKKVTITDDSRTSLTYEGVVERVAPAFLPKRSAAFDPLAAKQTVVLEVLIRVADPTPAGKPPLRVGQPVRVIFQ